MGLAEERKLRVKTLRRKKWAKFKKSHNLSGNKSGVDNMRGTFGDRRALSMTVCASLKSF